MRRVIAVLIIASLGWYGYSKYQYYVAKHRADEMQTQTPTRNNSAFTCDGRTQCSQMTSCAEATFFLKNCPGTKMDGDNNGIPCERQWCK